MIGMLTRGLIVVLLSPFVLAWLYLRYRRDERMVRADALGEAFAEFVSKGGKIAVPPALLWSVFVLGIVCIVAGGWRGGVEGWDALALALDAIGVTNIFVAAGMAGVFATSFWVQDGPPDRSRLDNLDRAHRGAHNERP